MSFAENLRELRKGKGLKQTELAKKLFVAQPTVATWEAGNREPDIVMLKKIAAFFGVTMDELTR